MIIVSRRDRDPYSWDHDDDCTGQNLREDAGLADAEELREEGVLACAGCSHEHGLLSDFVEHGFELVLFDRVMSALTLAALLENYPNDFRLRDIDARSVHDMMIVTAEQARYDVQQMLNDRNKS